MKLIAIIPARAGSKRLPGKNTMMICGRPLIAWNIIMCKCTKDIEEVWVTTDSEEIADISRRHGAKIWMREDPAESADEVGAGLPMLRAIEGIEKAYDFDALTTWVPTSILKKPEDIDGLIDEYKKIPEEAIWYASRNKENRLMSQVGRYYEYVIYDVDGQYLIPGAGGWDMFKAVLQIDAGIFL